MSNLLRPPTREPEATVRATPGIFSRYREALEKTLRDLVPASPPGIYGMLRYHLGWTDPDGNGVADPSTQGKALRPTLCLFACEVLSGSWHRALPAAAALELVHNFSLVHDDVQDGDVERRHRPTVWSLWGEGQALWAGNGLRSLGDLALLALKGQGLSHRQPLRASAVLTKAYLEMVEGQYLDLSFEERLDVGVEDYLDMVARKTGALIRCAMEVGAVVATEDEPAVQAFRRCGSHLGLAFQIRDDVLGTWGDQATTGKSAGNDVRRKKKTFPVIYGLEHASPEARETLLRLYSQPSLDADEAGWVLTLLSDLQAPQHAQALVEELTSQALQALADVELPSWGRQELQELAQFLCSRQR
ncbi:MAG: polyprenyl synthetase family protein [Dehalococcoidia bacterium]